MGFAVDGGIEWEKDTTNKILTVRPSDTPEEGYSKGQMKDYSEIGPWGQIQEMDWTLRLEDGITNIGNYAFNSCYGFTGILTIPNSVTSIGQDAFVGCTEFSGLILSNSISIIGIRAFMYCFGFRGSLVIPDGYREIGMNAFEGCGFDGLLMIGRCKGSGGIANNVFVYCSNLSAIYIAKEPFIIGAHAFEINDSSPAKTYDVYTSGWANTTTFPESTYTKWNYHTEMWDTMSVKIGDEWKHGKSYVKVNGKWKSGITYVKVNGKWELGK